VRLNRKWFFCCSLAVVLEGDILRTTVDRSVRSYLPGGTNSTEERASHVGTCADSCSFAVVVVDIWDGANDEPVIYHGYTLTSKILVKDVLQAVRDYAFIKSPCVFRRCRL